jgi:uncharacterized integral membrane protein (TIGR00698 family)
MTTASPLSLMLKFAPGLALSAIVAVAAVFAEPLVANAIRSATGSERSIPAIVIALLIGIAAHSVARHEQFQPGITFAVKGLLRIAIGLLGLRIALGDIVGLGVYEPILVVLAMALTAAIGIICAQLLGRRPETGALMGMATAVCGASAALATSTVLSNYPNKQADVAFAVIAANAVSTVAMVLYPPICALLGFPAHETGVMLGGTIHDMAQVVGAGYSVSDEVGNTAVIVKLFRIFLLLPMVLALGWWLHSRKVGTNDARVPIPVFAFIFIALCVVNSLMPTTGAYGTMYIEIRSLLIALSSWGLLIAISALGLGTSVSVLFSVGWRHLATFMVATISILVIVSVGLMLHKGNV